MQGGGCRFEFVYCRDSDDDSPVVYGGDMLRRLYPFSR